jgi:putative tryptophan/tyrosine transport system substrate-binding protein
MGYWAVAQLVPNRTSLALHTHTQQNFTVYAPKIRELRIIRGHKTELLSALFPGYAFVLKRLELARELVPSATVIAFLVNPANPTAEPLVREMEDAGRTLGRQVLVLKANTENDLFAVFSTLVKERAGALVVTADPLFLNRRDLLIALTMRHAVPAIFAYRDFARSGGLLSYGPSITDAHRQLGIYTGRILRGANPADLPVLQPTKFELVLNLKTARVIGLDLPASVLARADEVIE